MRALLLLLLLPNIARARELPAELSVEKTDGAETCRDQAELESRVENILHRSLVTSPGADPLRISVRFERGPDGAFEARVSATGPKTGQRLLRDHGPTCEALSEAVSVAIALLLDGALPDPDERAPSPAPSAPPERVNDSSSAPEELATRARRTASRDVEARFALQLGGAYGLGATSSVFGVGRGGLRTGHWLWELGATIGSPSSSKFGRGSVRTSLWFASFRACYELGRWFKLAPCAELALGRLRGVGADYGETRSASLPWTAAGLGLAGGIPLGKRLYATLDATLWAPTRRQTFSVQNSGIAWESKPLAGALSAGLGLALF